MCLNTCVPPLYIYRSFWSYIHFHDVLVRNKIYFVWNFFLNYFFLYDIYLYFFFYDLWFGYFPAFRVERSPNSTWNAGKKHQKQRVPGYFYNLHVTGQFSTTWPVCQGWAVYFFCVGSRHRLESRRWLEVHLNWISP